MGDLIRNVRDIDAGDRRSLEHLLGISLQENQQIIIRVQNVQPAETPSPAQADADSKLPDWCNVYEGLSDEEIDEIDKSIVRTLGSRSIA